jgi:hypothetical protein
VRPTPRHYGACGIDKVALIFNPNILRCSAAFDAAVQAGAKYGVRVITIPAQNTEDIERAVTAFAAEPDGGLIVLPPALLPPERQVLKSTALRLSVTLTLRQGRCTSRKVNRLAVPLRLALDPTRRGFDEVADLADQLGRALVETDDRALWVVRFGIISFFAARNSLRIHLGS